jgi:hypothetical protein
MGKILDRSVALEVTLLMGRRADAVDEGAMNAAIHSTSRRWKVGISPCKDAVKLSFTELLRHLVHNFWSSHHRDPKELQEACNCASPISWSTNYSASSRK